LRLSVRFSRLFLRAVRLPHSPRLPARPALAVHVQAVTPRRAEGAPVKTYRKLSPVRAGRTANDSRAVNSSTSFLPGWMQQGGANLGTYWARAEHPLRKRHTRPPRRPSSCHSGGERRAHGQPENQPGRCGDNGSGHPCAGPGVEVQDCPGAGEDLPQRLGFREAGATADKPPGARRSAGGPVQGRSLGGAGLPGLSRPAQHVCHADRHDRADDRPGQVYAEGAQVPDGDVGSEAAGGVHRGAVERAAHGAQAMM